MRIACRSEFAAQQAAEAAAEGFSGAGGRARNASLEHRARPQLSGHPLGDNRMIEKLKIRTANPTEMSPTLLIFA